MAGPGTPAAVLPGVVLAGQPWDWFEPFLETLRRWLGSDAVRELPANAALFLIMGGLSILSLIVFLVVLQSFLPSRAGGPTALDERPAQRQLRAVRPRRTLPRPAGGGDLATGRTEGGTVRAYALDAVLDQAIERGIGEPRILTMRPSGFRLRMYACGSCEPRVASQRRNTDTGCQHERGFLESAVQRLYAAARIEETQCRLRGQPYCEFEVSR